MKLIMYVANNQCIPVINTLAWSAIVSCVCKLILLFPVVFYLVVFVHVFNSGIVIFWRPNECNQWKVVDAVTEMFLTGPVFLFKVNVEIGSKPTMSWSKLFSSVEDYSYTFCLETGRVTKWTILKPYSSWIKINLKVRNFNQVCLFRREMNIWNSSWLSLDDHRCLS